MHFYTLSQTVISYRLHAGPYHSDFFIVETLLNNVFKCKLIGIIRFCLKKQQQTIQTHSKCMLPNEVGCGIVQWQVTRWKNQEGWVANWKSGYMISAALELTVVGRKQPMSRWQLGPHSHSNFEVDFFFLTAYVWMKLFRYSVLEFTRQQSRFKGSGSHLQSQNLRLNKHNGM